LASISTVLGKVAWFLTTIRARMLRLLARCGLDPDAEVSRPAPVAEESPVLAGSSSAAVQGRLRSVCGRARD
jgi:hypothetical protein